MPGMADPRFERAVVAMCVHDENGAIGITFRGLLRQLDIEPGEAPDCAVHHGGPVEPGRGFVLHSADWGGQDTLHVNGDNGEIFAMTGTIDVLRAIAEGRGPSEWIAELGYAGSGEGQLDETSFAGKVVGGVAERAARAGIRAVAVVGAASVDPPRGLATVVLVKRFGSERSWTAPLECIAEATVELLAG